MKNTWYIEAYIQNGATYCRNCVADTLSDKDFIDPYNLTEDDSFTPIFADQLQDFDGGIDCEYCFEVIYDGC